MKYNYFDDFYRYSNFLTTLGLAYFELFVCFNQLGFRSSVVQSSSQASMYAVNIYSKYAVTPHKITTSKRSLYQISKKSGPSTNSNLGTIFLNFPSLLP